MISAPYAETVEAVRLASEAHRQLLDRSSEHTSRGAALRSRLTELRAIRAQDLVAAALGTSEADPSMADAEIERLEAEVAANEQVEAAFKPLLAQKQAAVVAATAAQKSAVQAYLKANAVEPARAELQAALEQVGTAAAKLMAAHHLAYTVYSGNLPSLAGPAARYGPACELASDINGLDWRQVPYKLQPSWVRTTGQFYAPDLAGVAAETARLRADLEQQFAL